MNATLPTMFWPNGALPLCASPYSFVNLTRLGAVCDFFHRGLCMN